MPIYHYSHDCGYEQKFFLKANKDTVIATCQRCFRSVTARQLRDKSLIEKEKDGTIGILRREQKTRTTKR